MEVFSGSQKFRSYAWTTTDVKHENKKDITKKQILLALKTTKRWSGTLPECNPWFRLSWAAPNITPLKDASLPGFSRWLRLRNRAWSLDVTCTVFVFTRVNHSYWITPLKDASLPGFSRWLRLRNRAWSLDVTCTVFVFTRVNHSHWMW
jgi:ribosomal protein L37E